MESAEHQAEVFEIVVNELLVFTVPKKAEPT
jgi:hypothetical protein